MMDKRSNLPVRTAEIKLNDSYNPLFRLKWNDISKGSGESPNQYATISIDADGSDDSALIIFLNIGASSSDYTQYQFSASTSGVTDPGGVDSSPTHTECDTLGELIQGINALGVDANKHTSTDPVGLWAARLHAPADYSLATDDFIDLTEARIGYGFADYLYKDASEVLTMAYRLGVPDSINGKVGHGQFEFIKASALINSGGATDCVFTMSYDPTDTSASDEEVLGYTRYVPDNSWTELWDFHEMPPVLNGPVLIECTATSSMAANAQCLINYRSACE